MHDHRISDYIKLYENIFTPEDCAVILDEYKDCDCWRPARVGSRSTENLSVRNCDIMKLSLSHVINKNMRYRKEIDNMIYKKVGEVMKKYTNRFPPCHLRDDSGYDLLRYNTGGYYREHVDNSPDLLRTLAISINLNDDYVGGEVAFFGNKMHVKGGVGSVVAFPANFMYPHQVLDITEGTRYSIVTWFT